MTRTMYDAANPANIPDWDHMVAGYQHGWAGWLSPYELVTRRPAQAARLILIDNTGSTPTLADVLDVETGAATVGDAHTWCASRHARGWWSCVYCSASNLPAVRSATAGTNTEYWVANWALNEAEATAQLGGDIVAVQWASPSSNHLPGYDQSVVGEHWFAPPAPAAIAASLLQAVHKVAALADSCDQAAHAVLDAVSAPA